MMKHASNEKKRVPYLNGNPTRTVAISKAVALLDISVGIRINYDTPLNTTLLWARESRRTRTVAFLTKRTNLS